MVKAFFKWLAIFSILLIIVYLFGPRVKFKPIDKSPITFDIPLETLDAYIEDQENQVLDLKPGNEAKIVWADSTYSKTDYSVVYLHGFSASRVEGAPLHREFAKRYGFNLYLPRLYDHGRNSDDTFKGLLPEDLINSAKEAIAVGKLLGEKVILMTCSTGGTYGAILAPYDDAIHSMYLYSPNIDLYDTNSNLMLKPWGRQILTLVMGGEYNHVNYNDTARKYWSEKYHTDGLLALKYLLDEEMTASNFDKIKLPIYLGYYYKDEEHQDKVVSVERMLEFYDQVRTPQETKRIQAFPDAGRHVMTSYVFSKDLESVQNEAYRYAEEVLGLIPK